MSVEKHRKSFEDALNLAVDTAINNGVLYKKDVARALAERALGCLNKMAERPLAIQEAMSALNAAVGFLVDEGALDNPSHRFVDNGDGTVTDTNTKLMWKQCAEGQNGPDCQGESKTFTWDIAMQIPKMLNQRGGFAGYHDWRLPTKTELVSLVVRERTHPAICTEAFPNASSNAFWSSSPSVDYDAWYVHFIGGDVGNNNRGHAFAVRLVRASQCWVIEKRKSCVNF